MCVDVFSQDDDGERYGASLSRNRCDDVCVSFFTNGGRSASVRHSAASSTRLGL